MKKQIILLCVLVVAIVGFSNTAAVFKWNETTHDFGGIKKDVPVTHKFLFRNEGTIPLIISGANAPCGCTVADYSKDPIAPGAQGYVKATYNAAKPGVFTKTVSVQSNAAENPILTLKGEVMEIGD